MIITYTDSARHGECAECGKSFIRREMDADDDGKLCRSCYLRKKQMQAARDGGRRTMSDATEKHASAYFADCEIAIETVCRGCPDENGYIDEPKPWGADACPNMVAIYNDEPCQLTEHGNDAPTCPIRDAHLTKNGRAEWEKYQRRMKGDWR